MKEKEKRIILSKLLECCDSLKIWKKKSHSLVDIQKQFTCLKRANWKYFQLPEEVRAETGRALELRFIEECHSITKELSNITELKNELSIHESTYHSYCLKNLATSNHITSFDELKTLTILINCLELIVGMIELSLRNISLSDEESSSHLSEMNQSIQKVNDDIEGKTEVWRSHI